MLHVWPAPVPLNETWTYREFCPAGSLVGHDAWCKIGCQAWIVDDKPKGIGQQFELWNGISFWKICFLTLEDSLLVHPVESSGFHYWFLLISSHDSCEFLWKYGCGMGGVALCEGKGMVANHCFPRSFDDSQTLRWHILMFLYLNEIQTLWFLSQVLPTSVIITHRLEANPLATGTLGRSLNSGCGTAREQKPPWTSSTAASYVSLEGTSKSGSPFVVSSSNMFQVCCLILISHWWFGTFLLFHILGIIIPTDFHILQRGWNHQADIHWLIHVDPNIFSIDLFQSSGPLRAQWSVLSEFHMNSMFPARSCRL